MPVKERPILMSGAMVPPTLGGIKTQTRRIIKSQPHDGATGLKAGVFTPIIVGLGGIQMPGEDVFGFYDDSGEYGIKCPYGQPGDRLWVRETWAPAYRDGYDAAPQDGRPGFDEDDPDTWNFGPCWYRATDEAMLWECKWKPSIFMPRAASRITLEILSIRIQRLLEITEDDAIAEGLIPHGTGFARGWQFEKDGCIYATAKRCYEALWEKINGAGSWEANPYVAAIEFRKMEAS